MKNLKSQMWMGIICAILGIMISLQFKYVNNPRNTANTKRVEDLVKEVENLKLQRDDLLKKVGEAEKKVDEMEMEFSTSDAVASNLKLEVDRLRSLAGTTEVKGEGIIVTINAPTGLEASTGVIVNEYDIIAIINELNATLAEAVSINGERYTSRTAIRSAGASIRINGNPYDPYKEFKINAIGDPKNLKTALTITGGIVDMLNEQEISVKIETGNNIIIPGVKKVFEPKFIK